ncbi:uncharacterized protein A1O5_09660 [Cladophialophora psammophila CBS 110553]|uniref:Uncharacterized protein n=1 Tax=Cladophialophora psammophila CBS 110553 TaxID=1182543 RepID=W9X989_9EURO|nr:uncharacterized protein A1O5_09660 [Cladophialophora psammophila CBS 110553]EXJ67014.1 hypothetical protein A1O5_09660 [Cladophialophora psammophila CBS 110553]
MKFTSESSNRRPLLSGPYHSAPWRPGPAILQKYDSESGQTYSELEVRPNRHKYSDWIGEPKTPGMVQKPPPNENGARSLAGMARIKVATQFRNLTSEHFATVPWSMARRVWDQLLSMRAESFHAWRTLAAAYPGPEEFGAREYRYLLDIKQPLVPITTYFNEITSKETKWFSCLRISPKEMAASSLMSIHTITNLAVLDLSDGQVTIDNEVSKFDERFLRSWAELARSREAFQHLRVILFGWQEHLSDWIFKYTDCFPSLCHIIITDCPRMHQKNRAMWELTSQAAGWEAMHAKKSAKSLRPIIGNQDFAFGSISGCYYDSMELFSQLVHNRRPNLADSRPLLELWIGNPRQWSHIVDDFPSTRTIFLENIKRQNWKATEGPSTGGDREPAKRMRNQEQAAPEAASPPSKRGSRARPAMKSHGKNVLADMLNEFKT